MKESGSLSGNIAGMTFPMSVNLAVTGKFAGLNTTRMKKTIKRFILSGMKRQNGDDAKSV